MSNGQKHTTIPVAAKVLAATAAGIGTAYGADALLNDGELLDTLFQSDDGKKELLTLSNVGTVAAGAAAGVLTKATLDGVDARAQAKQEIQQQRQNQMQQLLAQGPRARQGGYAEEMQRQAALAEMMGTQKG